MAEQLRAIAHGRVQGVSFRHYTVLKASELGLTGWVRNLPDHTVETLAEGEKEQLERFLTWLHVGPPAAHVTQVDVYWSPASGKFADFHIWYG
jgi:acylphosphatase